MVTVVYNKLPKFFLYTQLFYALSLKYISGFRFSFNNEKSGKGAFGSYCYSVSIGSKYKKPGKKKVVIPIIFTNLM